MDCLVKSLFCSQFLLYYPVITLTCKMFRMVRPNGPPEPPIAALMAQMTQVLAQMAEQHQANQNNQANQRVNIKDFLSVSPKPFVATRDRKSVV